jgi:hypothetical protein
VITQKLNDDGGCKCEYLSEQCGGAAVVCQYCHDAVKADLARAEARVRRLTAKLIRENREINWLRCEVIRVKNGGAQ